MTLNELIKNVETVIKRTGRITFSYPGCDNGNSFGIIQKSNMPGIFIAGKYYYIGDGDISIEKPEAVPTVEAAFRYIWRINHCDERYGSCDRYDFIFYKVSGLCVDNCFYILK